MRRLLYVIVGFTIAAFGALGTLIGVIAVLDPVGAKLADDADPFVPPSGTVGSVLKLLAYLALLCVGVWLGWRGGRAPVSSGGPHDAV